MCDVRYRLLWWPLAPYAEPHISESSNSTPANSTATADQKNQPAELLGVDGLLLNTLDALFYVRQRAVLRSMSATWVLVLHTAQSCCNRGLLSALPREHVQRFGGMGEMLETYSEAELDVRYTIALPAIFEADQMVPPDDFLPILETNGVRSLEARLWRALRAHCRAGLLALSLAGMVYVSRLKQKKQQSGLVFFKLLEDSWLIFLLAFVSAGYAALLLWCLVRVHLLLCSILLPLRRRHPSRVHYTISSLAGNPLVCIRSSACARIGSLRALFR